MAESSNGGKALKAGIGYTIGNILIRGISFLLLPIFSRIMDTEQFGIYNAFLSYDSILYVITGFALHSSVKSAHYTFKNETDQYVSSISIIYLINFALFTLLTLLFGNSISHFLNLPVFAIYMLILYSSGTALLTLYNNRISLDYAYKEYLIISLVNTLGNIGLSLFLIFCVFNNQRALGRIGGSSITIACIAVYILVALYRKAKPRYKKEYWKFGILYSLPIVPHGISQVLLSQFDKIMIRSMIGDSATGIYSLASNLKAVLAIITQSAATAWETWFFEEIDKGHKEIIKRKAAQVVCGFTILTAGMMALAPELILFLGGERYMGGKHVVVPMILDCFILFLYNVIVPSEYYMKKTKYIMLGTIISAVINIITNYIFIRKYGYIAAAYTTLFSYVCYIALHMFISYRLVKFSIVPNKQLIFFVIVLVALGIYTNIHMDSLLMRAFAGIIVTVGLTIILYRNLKKEGLDPIEMVKKFRKAKS